MCSHRVSTPCAQVARLRELADEIKRKEAEAEAAEREARVKKITEQAVRRLGKRELSLGWEVLASPTLASPPLLALDLDESLTSPEMSP